MTKDMPPPTSEKYARYVNPSFVKLLGILGYGRIYTKTSDVWIWDDKERKYLDFLAGFGTINIGHNHPRILQKIREFTEKNLLNFYHTGPSPFAAELAQKLAKLSAPPLEISLFSSSGAEAVEAGLKLARAATKRPRFLYCEGGFHGTNLGTLSVMGQTRIRKPFEPLLDGCQAIAFGNLEQLAQQLAQKDVAGFLLEPIQAEAGVILPPASYLAEAKKLCQKYKTLLILDEVQTGLGRTGTMFAYEQEQCTPDILVLAKALSGGIAPIAATLTSAKIFHKAYGSPDRFDLHSSTFEGNTLSCMVASETLDILVEENLHKQSAKKGEFLLSTLRQKLIGHPFVKDIRGRGLLVAIELGPTQTGWANKLSPALVSLVSERVFGQWLAVKLLEKGVICQPAAHQWNILKIEPPLTISQELLEEGIKAIEEIFLQYSSLSKLLMDVSGRIGSQLKRGWEFR